MKIFLSIFAVSITVFFFLSLPVVYSWIYYLSETIHKNYMFLFCNGLLVFIRLNSRSSCKFSLEKEYGREQGEKKQAAAWYGERKPPNRSRTVGEIGDEEEAGSVCVVVKVRENEVLIAEDDDEKAGTTLSVMVEEICDDHDGDVPGDDKTLPVNVEETRDDDGVEGEEEHQGEEEQQEEELQEQEQEQEQDDSINTISLEELNKKCEEFIRRMKAEIRIGCQTIQCH